ncbi:MAG: DinB family protein [Gemmatimonadota bacterium]
MTAFPYVTETLALLGDRDPLAVMAETPGWLATHIEALASGVLTQPEAPGKWSIAQVLAHLADAEIAYGWRLRILLTQENPPLPGYDQGAWLARFDYAGASPAMSLATFTALRNWNLRVWRTATAADLERLGVHPERGPEPLSRLRQLAAGHDLRHRRQIERILKVVG